MIIQILFILTAFITIGVLLSWSSLIFTDQMFTLGGWHFFNVTSRELTYPSMLFQVWYWSQPLFV